MEMTYGKRPVQSSKHQTYTHNVMGEVTLVWGLLRLAPIKLVA